MESRCGSEPRRLGRTASPRKRSLSRWTSRASLASAHPCDSRIRPESPTVSNVRRIVVTHHGVPLGRVGTLRLTTGDLLVGEMECVAAYAALRPTIWEVSR